MLELLQPIADACRLDIPAVHKLPIAIVGAGAIPDVGHLPAYKQAGLEIRGIFDLDAARAKDVAARHGIPTVYDSLDALMEDKSVQVVDIAVVPWKQPEIAIKAFESGKHALCQKPFAVDPAGAQSIVDAADRLGKKVAVNQQLRFDEGIMAAREMIRRGWIGELNHIQFNISLKTDWGAWPWLLVSDRLEIQYHSLHYIDAIRSLMGEPDRIFTATSRMPGQAATAETRSTSTLCFPDGRHAIVMSGHENPTPDNEATFRIEGSKGAIRGTLGLLYNYPYGRPDTLEVFSSALPTDGWLSYPVTTRWLPDAFAGPMKSLLEAIATGGEALTCGRDNLKTIALIDGAYASSRTGLSQKV